MSKRAYTIVDLFSGAGGMTQGFVDASFEPVFAVECDEAAADTYAANFGGHVFRGLIENLSLSDLPSADVIIGGPPCQGFSPLGRMSTQERRPGEHEALNGLWRNFMDAIAAVQPKAFVMENVPQILKSLEFEAMRKTAEETGYNIAHGVLNAVDFGVPQQRRRAFILGVLEIPAELPGTSEQRSTVRDAIGHLPLVPDGRNWHVGRNPTAKSIERYRCVPPGGNRFDLAAKRPDLTPACWLRKKAGSTDVFGRLDWDRPALTIRTEFFKPEKGRYLHPEADRPITHREAALLQTFPEAFDFRGSRIQVARQIGNAVPPRLAKALALKVRCLIDTLDEGKAGGSPAQQGVGSG